MKMRAWFLVTALSVGLLGCGDDAADGSDLGGRDGQENPGTGGDGDTSQGDGDAPWPGGDGDISQGDGDTSQGDGDVTQGDGDAWLGDDDQISDEGFFRGPEPTVESASKPGRYQVETATSGWADSPDYADATLHWPTDAKPPFAFVAVVPGFFSPQSSTQPWGPFLASHGIVAMTIGTNNLTDQPPARATALLSALNTVAAENTRMGSPLFGKLDLSRQAVIGWSMGGGGALLAAEKQPSLKALIALTPWNPGYSYSKVTTPAMLLAAMNDSLAGGQSKGFYESIPQSTPKFYFESTNNSDFFSGHDTFNNPKNLQGAVGRYGLAWLKVFLEGDTRYRSFLLETPPTTNGSEYLTNL